MTSTRPSLAHCPNCGSPLAERAPGGLCSACLIESALFGEFPEPEPPAPAATRRIGAYELVQELARGGMGVVWKARQLPLKRYVALKLLHGGAAASPTMVRRFRTEAEAASGLDHPHIVPIYEVGEHDGQPFFSMKLLEGGTLAEAIRRREPALSRTPNADDPFASETTIARLLVKLAHALHFAHQRGILHRDIKPTNILLDAQGEPQLADFGLAKLLADESGLTHSNAVVGTPSYLAPELAEGGARQVTTAVDVYGLGAVLYELLTGQPPFVGAHTADTLRRVVEEEPVPPRRRLRQQGMASSTGGPATPAAAGASRSASSSGIRFVSRDLETICLKCLAKNPGRRYPSAEALAEDLERWLRHEPITARPATPVESLAKWTRRHPAIAALLLTVVLAVAVIFGLTTSFGWRISRQAEASRQQLVRLQVAEGNHLASEGDASLALLRYVEALRLDAADPERARVHRLRIGVALRQAPQLVRLVDHTRAANTAVFSPDGEWLVTASDDGSVRQIRLHDDHSTNLAPGWTLHLPAEVSAAFFGPDARLLLTTCANHTAQLWDGVTGQPLLPAVNQSEFKFKRPGTRNAVLTADGRILVIANRDTVSQFAVPAGTPVGSPLRHPESVMHVAVSADGRRLATLDADGQARLWDARTSELRAGPWAVEGLSPGEWCGVWFAPDGTTLLTANNAGFAQLWDATHGQPRSPRLRHPSECRLLGAGFSPDARWAYTVGTDRHVRLWNATNGAPAGVNLESDPELQAARFSPDGRWIALSTLSQTTRIRRVDNGALAQPILHHTGSALFADFSPDNTAAAIATQDGLVEVWRWSTNAARELPHGGRLVAADFSPDGQRVLTASTHGTLRVWDSHSGDALRGPLGGDIELVCAAFHPDGRQAATGDAVGFAHLWDLEAPRELVAPLPHPAAVRRVVFHPGGHRLLTLTRSDQPGASVATVWDLRTGQPAFPPIPHPSWLDWCEFSPDGRRFLTTCADGNVRVFDSATGGPVGAPMPTRGWSWEAHFSPDGTTLVAANADATYDPRDAYVFEVATGRRVTALSGHQDGVLQALFSPDGRTLATGGEDSVVRLWDAATGRARTPPLAHEGKITRVVFSRDSRLVATASWDGTSRVWDAATGEAVTPPLPHDRVVRAIAFRPDGQQLLSAGDDGVARLWMLPVATESLAELTARAQLLSAHRLGPAGQLERLSRETRESLPPGVRR